VKPKAKVLEGKIKIIGSRDIVDEDGEYCLEMDEDDPSSSARNQQPNTTLNVRQRGRPSNSCYSFAEGHPLHATHVQRLRSKLKVPVPCRVPRPPPIKPRILTESWKKQAREFSRFFLVLFRPWKLQIEGNLILIRNYILTSEIKMMSYR